jgi:hypothetical protein
MPFTQDELNAFADQAAAYQMAREKLPRRARVIVWMSRRWWSMRYWVASKIAGFDVNEDR